MIALLVLPTQFVHAFTHLPQILSHYQDTRSSNVKSESFFNFFITHVTENSHTTTEHRSDNDLPCKHQHSNSVISFIVFHAVPEDNTFSGELTFQKEDSKNYQPVHGKVCSYEASIWQPPQS
jgi:hypothetical protein